jgi:hypothetical protein
MQYKIRYIAQINTGYSKVEKRERRKDDRKVQVAEKIRDTHEVTENTSLP